MITGAVLVVLLATLAGLVFATVATLHMLRSWKKEADGSRLPKQVQDLHMAARSGDVAGVQAALKNGAAVDASDLDGNTALHHACYHGQEEAIRRLVKFGADDTLRNKEGLTPSAMRRLAVIEEVVREAARLLTDHGTWNQPQRARQLYDALRSEERLLYLAAIVRVVLQKERERRRRAIERGVTGATAPRKTLTPGGLYGPRRILMLAVKLGVPGSEQRLLDVLDAYGDKALAEDYLNSGSEVLATGAVQWARVRGYKIVQAAGRHGVVWGVF